MERQPEIPRIGRHRAETSESRESLDAVITESLGKALKNNTPIGRHGAIAIASRLIERYEEEYELGALNDYVVTGDTRNGLVRGEYLALSEQPDVSRDDKELIAWLAEAIIDAEQPFLDRPPQRTPGSPRLDKLLWNTTAGEGRDALHVWVRADASNETIAELPERLAPYLNAMGDAFRAFLSLPDVEATSEDIFESFNVSFVGTYPLDREQVLREVAEYGALEDAVRKAAADYGLSDAVSIDAEYAWEIFEKWVYDVVELGGAYHVFTK
jgi:hypothetical protein